MQRVKLPVHLDPAKAAQKQTSFYAVIEQRYLPRLSDWALEDGMVEVTLSCDRDEQRLVVLDVQLETRVKLTCQRCHEPLEIDIKRHVQFSPIDEDEDGDQLPESYEPAVMSESGEVNLHQLIEDEILLAAPVVPMHELKDCARDPSDMTWGEIDEAAEEKVNPFAVLSQLKKK